MEQVHSIFQQCRGAVIRGTIILSVAFVLFTLIERISQVSRAKKPWRSTLLDVQYAYLSMIYPPFLYFLISAFFGWMALELNPAAHNPGMAWGKFAIELMMILFIRDGLIYLRHRIFHTRPVWAYHSIHHSSEEVNWISAVRFHPAENIIEGAAEVTLFIVAGALGVDVAVLSVSGFIIGAYNLLIHANIRWTFGPLRFFLVSPVFHRWHHSDLSEARDKNFAAMFSCIDLALGTFYMPKNMMPETTGLSAEEKKIHPRTLAGQFLYPFRKR
jgi:sterol desaturase/sphingolipid hydroxylase (fatty acid hydroxylase superfamily)